MIIYSNSKRDGLWRQQLKGLLKAWKDGKETMFIFPNVHLLSRKTHLMQHADKTTDPGELFHAVIEMVNPNNPHWRKPSRRRKKAVS